MGGAGQREDRKIGERREAREAVAGVGEQFGDIMQQRQQVISVVLTWSARGQ